ncbi:MAG: polysaccharide biosynthesis protein [Acidibrevibacterium sp.]|uniref:polysaccharide biosynthesis protein n=1 Tax=Acidibrevibacterium fodinaquatile TaxID=1969806 RepID=UPI0023A7A1FE|nr:nucleoside-diphosphate sugar epimerase/dehydratase [Acidibrevibacterium fodinaquatile]MCA7118832.1 polysaccharide biosynthesis protein [Acidibrevibacterium fodinaquatile]
MAVRNPSLIRLLVNVVLDGALGALAVPLAFWLARPEQPLASGFAIAAGAIALIAGGVPFGLATQYWRFAGLGDMRAIAGSAVLGAGLYALLFLAAGLALPSVSFPAIHALALAILLAAPRLAYRLWRDRRDGRAGEAGDAVPILLVGDGEGADLFLRALGRGRGALYRVLGLLAPSARQTGRRIQGQPILGTIAETEQILEKLAAAETPPRFLVVTTDLPGETLGHLLECADRAGLSVRRAPDPTRLAAASTARAQAGLDLRPIAIEDILNRKQVPLDRDGMARLIAGRRVLITGAGGSIGAELSRQVAGFGPAEIALLDNGEYALWQIDLELATAHPTLARSTLIADIRDAARLRAVCERFRPDLVFHAAALKHVPMVEANPLEGLLSNAVGTRNVADAARAAGATVMVQISTDKAVNPTSVMGAAKRLAEMYCQALDLAGREKAGGLRCITVRFGNVLGSTGSVVPLFQRQLAAGGPLTVTHPDMRRYFMTVREAVGLVLQAAVVGTTAPELSEAALGGIFVLDMGEPVKIVDLARQMIRLAGLRPETDIAIRFTGLRAGEKLFEEMFHGQEPPKPTRYPGLLMAAPRTADLAIISRALDELAGACSRGQEGQALALLARLVPEFSHNAAGAARA